jgi:hypothetical protein
MVPWRELEWLARVTVLPMTPEEIAFFKSVAGGRKPPSRRPREAWLAIGRRGGKDSVILAIATHAAASFNPKGILRPGERVLVAAPRPIAIQPRS